MGRAAHRFLTFYAVLSLQLYICRSSDVVSTEAPITEAGLKKDEPKDEDTGGEHIRAPWLDPNMADCEKNPPCLQPPTQLEQQHKKQRKDGTVASWRSVPFFAIPSFPELPDPDIVVPQQPPLPVPETLRKGIEELIPPVPITPVVEREVGPALPAPREVVEPHGVPTLQMHTPEPVAENPLLDLTKPFDGPFPPQPITMPREQEVQKELRNGPPVVKAPGEVREETVRRAVQNLDEPPVPFIPQPGAPNLDVPVEKPSYTGGVPAARAPVEEPAQDERVVFAKPRKPRASVRKSVLTLDKIKRPKKPGVHKSILALDNLGAQLDATDTIVPPKTSLYPLHPKKVKAPGRLSGILTVHHNPKPTADHEEQDPGAGEKKGSKAAGRTEEEQEVTDAQAGDGEDGAGEGAKDEATNGQADIQVAGEPDAEAEEAEEAGVKTPDGGEERSAVTDSAGTEGDNQSEDENAAGDESGAPGSNEQGGAASADEEYSETAKSDGVVEDQDSKQAGTESDTPDEAGTGTDNADDDQGGGETGARDEVDGRNDQDEAADDGQSGLTTDDSGGGASDADGENGLDTQMLIEVSHSLAKRRVGKVEGQGSTRRQKHTKRARSLGPRTEPAGQHMFEDVNDAQESALATETELGPTSAESSAPAAAPAIQGPAGSLAGVPAPAHFSPGQRGALQGPAEASAGGVAPVAPQVQRGALQVQAETSAGGVAPVAPQVQPGNIGALQTEFGAKPQAAAEVQVGMGSATQMPAAAQNIEGAAVSTLESSGTGEPGPEEDVDDGIEEDMGDDQTQDNQLGFTDDPIDSEVAPTGNGIVADPAVPEEAEGDGSLGSDNDGQDGAEVSDDAADAVEENPPYVGAGDIMTVEDEERAKAQESVDMWKNLPASTCKLAAQYHHLWSAYEQDCQQGVDYDPENPPTCIFRCKSRDEDENKNHPLEAIVSCKHKDGQYVFEYPDDLMYKRPSNTSRLDEKAAEEISGNKLGADEFEKLKCRPHCKGPFTRYDYVQTTLYKALSGRRFDDEWYKQYGRNVYTDVVLRRYVDPVVRHYPNHYNNQTAYNCTWEGCSDIDDSDISEELMLMHGGPREISGQHFNVLNDDGDVAERNFTKKDMVEDKDGNVTEMMRQGWLNEQGCPSGELDIKFLNGEPLGLPSCKVACKNHRDTDYMNLVDNTSHVTAVGDIWGNLLPAITNDLECVFDPVTKDFYYPQPLRPLCTVAACWGYYGADVRVNRAKLKNGECQPPSQEFGKSCVLTWDDNHDAYGNPDIVWMPGEGRPQCTAPAKKKEQTHPTPVYPFPQASIGRRVEEKRSQLLVNIKKLLLAPWPAKSDIWAADKVPTAPFPVPAINCSLLNLNNELTKNGKLMFKDNPTPDLKKEAWEVGGLCSPETVVKDVAEVPTAPKEEAQAPKAKAAVAKAAEGPKEEAKVVEEAERIKKLSPISQEDALSQSANCRRSSCCAKDPLGAVMFDASSAFGIKGGSLQIRTKRTSSTYLNSLTPGDVLRHVQTASTQQQWKDASLGGFRCSDDVSTEPMLGAPGGDFGEFVLAMAVWERSGTKKPESAFRDLDPLIDAGGDQVAGSGVFLEMAQSSEDDKMWPVLEEEDSADAAPAKTRLELTDEDVFDALVAWLVDSSVRQFHFCTDGHALDSLCKRLQWCPVDLDSWMNAPSHLLPQAIEHMKQEEFVGSRFIKLLMIHAEKHNIRAGLVKASVGALYSLLWGSMGVKNAKMEGLITLARSKLHPGITKITNRAGAILNVYGSDCPSTMYPAVPSQAPFESQVMVMHPTALRDFQLRLAAILTPKMFLDPAADDVDRVHGHLSLLSSETWLDMVGIYAEALPQFCVHYEAPNGQRCTFNPPFQGSTEALSDIRYVPRGALAVVRDGRVPKAQSSKRNDGEAEISFDALTRSEVVAFVSKQPSKWVTSLLHGYAPYVGRQTEPVLGTAGGDIGQFIIALAAFEQSTGKQLNDREVNEKFYEYVNATMRPSFTMYTTVEALGYLCQQGHFCSSIVDLDDPSQRAKMVLDRLVSLGKSASSKLIEWVCMDKALGDSFVLLLATDAEELGVRSSLARAVVKAFYLMLWSSDAAKEKLDLVVLQGDAGKERALLDVFSMEGAPANQAPMLQPNLNGVQVAIYHEDATRLLRLHFLEMLFSTLPKEFSQEFGRIRINADEMGSQLKQKHQEIQFWNLPQWEVYLA